MEGGKVSACSGIGKKTNIEFIKIKEKIKIQASHSSELLTPSMHCTQIFRFGLYTQENRSPTSYFSHKDTKQPN